MAKRVRRPKTITVPRNNKNCKKYKVIEAWDRVLVDMRLFHRNTNWAEMWEDFYLAVDEHGGWKYKTIRQFVDARAESMEQRRFMFWWLGGSGEQHPEYSKIVPAPHLPL